MHLPYNRDGVGREFESARCSGGIIEDDRRCSVRHGVHREERAEATTGLNFKLGRWHQRLQILRVELRVDVVVGLFWKGHISDNYSNNRASDTKYHADQHTANRYFEWHTLFFHSNWEGTIL